MNNWPRMSIYEPYDGPLEVEGGLLFEPGRYTDARACAARAEANGLSAMVWTCPRDLGVFVAISA